MKTLVTALLGLFVGCSPHKVTHNPAPPVPPPASYKTQSGSQSEQPEKWWTEFGDADLSQLVDTALKGNLQLHAAWARLEQANAVGRQIASGKWPQLEASLSASRQKIRSPFADSGDAAAGMLPETFETDSFSGSIKAGYELDLWKRISSQEAGAVLNARALRDDAELIAITLVAELSESWFDLVFRRSQKKLLQEQVKVSEMFLELVTLRFRQGLATSLDIKQQEQQLIATRAQLPLVEAAIEVLQFRLAVLIGQAPGPALGGTRDSLPDLPVLPGAGIPAELLDRRPDVRAARLRAEAADYDVAAAVADRLPSLRLSGSVGKQSGEIGDFFSTPTVWSLLSSIVGPLFDGGRRKAEVDRNEAVVKERLALYGHALLQAIAEVDSALVQERQQLAHIKELEQQLKVANAALDDARQRYREGLAKQGFLQVLSALQTQQRSELGLLLARRQVLSHRIQLCRALGGTWTRSLTPNEAKEK